MSCNGCRILRKKCSEWCSLRSCLQWIDSPTAQASATLFLAKFFGRRDLMFLIESVPCCNRSELFRSLLYEACGRMINPIYGAIGLLCSGRWHLCEASVATVLAGGVLTPLTDAALDITLGESSDGLCSQFQHAVSDSFVSQKSSSSDRTAPVRSTGEESCSTNYDICIDNEIKLLNLFE